MLITRDGGGLLGALDHKDLGLDGADRERIGRELGKAAVGVLAPVRRPRGGPVTRQPDDSDPSRRPPDYVIVVAAGDWLKRRFPAAAASLTDALHAGQNRHREPDLEAEP